MAESNKTERATPKKRRDEEKKGNVFQSKDVVSVFILLLAFVLLSALAGFVSEQVSDYYTKQVSRIGLLDTLTVATCSEIVRELFIFLFICVLPMMLVICIVAIAASGVQTKFNFSTEKLKPKFSKINPLEGIKRIISMRSLVQLAKSLLKVVVISIIIWGSIREVLKVTPDMFNTEIAASIKYMMEQMMSMVYKICLLFFGIAVLDFAYEKFDYEKRMKMTKQEVKDEYKQTEGDPFIKGKRRERMRKMSMNRMIQQIPTADVIVRNPTHFAVAIKYDIDKDFAPIVVAKGQDRVAMRIVEEAQKHDILMTENKPLARALYEKVEINELVPQEMYKAVAEVMAWVYQVRKKEIAG